MSILDCVRRSISELVGAGLFALATGQTAVLEDNDFRLRGQPFRIMAPPAAERASLEEHGSAYPRSILNRVLLDVEYYAAYGVCFIFHSVLISGINNNYSQSCERFQETHDARDDGGMHRGAGA